MKTLLASKNNEARIFCLKWASGHIIKLQSTFHNDFYYNSFAYNFLYIFDFFYNVKNTFKKT